MQLSSRVKNITESVTLRLNTLAMEMAENGKQVYNLSAGQLPFRPPQEFIESIKTELDFLKSYHYSPVAGFPELRKKMMNHIEVSRGIDLNSPELAGEEFDCVISNGAKHSISSIFGAIIEPNDEIIIISPYWSSYPEIIKFCKGVPVIVKSSVFDAFTPSIKDIQKAVTPKTKAIIINSPNNPTGIHYSSAWMDEFAEFLEKNSNLLVVSDEIYFEVCYYDPRPTYFYQKNPKLLSRTVIVDGISKAFASTGLRIGYCVAPKNLCRAIENLQGQLTSGASSLIQRAMLNYNFNSSSAFLAPVKNHLRENSIVIRDKLKEYDLLKCWYQPSSAFYFMVDFSQLPIIKKYQKDAQDKTDYSAEICEDLLAQTGVVIVPGRDFGLSNSARISLVLPKESFTEAIDKMMKFVRGS